MDILTGKKLKHKIPFIRFHKDYNSAAGIYAASCPYISDVPRKFIRRLMDEGGIVVLDIFRDDAYAMFKED